MRVHRKLDFFCPVSNSTLIARNFENARHGMIFSRRTRVRIVTSLSSCPLHQPEKYEQFAFSKYTRQTVNDTSDIPGSSGEGERSAHSVLYYCVFVHEKTVEKRVRVAVTEGDSIGLVYIISI